MTDAAARMSGGGGGAAAGGGGSGGGGGGGGGEAYSASSSSYHLDKQFFHVQGQCGVGPGGAVLQPQSRLKCITGIQFGMFSGADMQRMAHLQVCSKELYRMPPNREAVPYGVLDLRLGVSGTQDLCGTCGRNKTECPGHWGVIVLELPVFHLGFLKATINVLQNICKTCSRVLLRPEERKGLLRALRDPRTDSLRRTRLRKRITEMTKKCALCPWCGALNGSVKKVNAITAIRMLHDRYKLAKGAPKDEARKAFLDQVETAARSWVPAGTQGYDPGLVAHAKQRAFEELSPVRVMELFKAIPDADLDLLWMDRALGRPECMLTTNIMVPPVAIRPSVPMEAGGGSNEDDITMQLQKIVHSNAALKLALSKGGSGKMMQENWDWLQVCAAAMVNGEVPGFPPTLKPKRPIRGLAQRLKGKQGRFRGNLSGKRVDFSGRTVIGPDPNLPIYAVGVPFHVARIMTFPERVTAINIAKMRAHVLNGYAQWPGANAVRCLDGSVILLKPMAEDAAGVARLAKDLRIGDVVERHMVDGDVVLFNRQPSLHKMSIMAHRAKVLPGRTFRFNECVCTPYNADFDGDEMNVHLPQTEEARAEAACLMDVRDNMINSRSGEPLIAAHQDFITAAWLLTQRDTLLDRDAMCQILCLMGDAGEEVAMPIPCVLKPGPFWSGKQVISLLLRPNPRVSISASFESRAKNYSISAKDTSEAARIQPMCPKDGWVVMRDTQLMCGNLDKNSIGTGSKTGLIYVLIRENGGRTAANTLIRITKMTSRWLANWGFSMGFEDVTPSANMKARKKSMVDEKYEECEALIRKFRAGEMSGKELQPGCDEEQSLEVLLGGKLSDLRQKLGEMCSAELPYHCPPRIMAECGSKGSLMNISQMIACVGQQQVGGTRIEDGFVNRTLPIFLPGAKEPKAKGFVANSFFSGLDATEFFMHTMGGRESLVDTAVKTAETGYMQRRMMKSMEDLSVQYDGTVRTSSADVVQFAYGDDGLDPAHMEAAQANPSALHKPGEFELGRCLAGARLPRHKLAPLRASATPAAAAAPAPQRRQARAEPAAAAAAQGLGCPGGVLSALGGADARARAAAPLDERARTKAQWLQDARLELRQAEARSARDEEDEDARAAAIEEASRALEAAEKSWREAEALVARMASAQLREALPAAPGAGAGAGASAASRAVPLDTVLTAAQIRELSLGMLTGPKARSTTRVSKARLLSVAAGALGGHVALMGQGGGRGGRGGGGGSKEDEGAGGGSGGGGASEETGFLGYAGEAYIGKVARFVVSKLAEPVEDKSSKLFSWLKSAGKEMEEEEEEGGGKAGGGAAAAAAAAPAPATGSAVEISRGRSSRLKREPELAILSRSPVLRPPPLPHLQPAPQLQPAAAAAAAAPDRAAEVAGILSSTVGITAQQLITALDAMLEKYTRASIHPGEAVGAVAAHSLGEPATQMTLRTFHFAGVASMNVTRGVPRIKEIMNAAKSIASPIILAPLENPDSELSARLVKGRIEKTVLGDVAVHIAEVYEQRSGWGGGGGGGSGGGGGGGGGGAGASGAYLEIVLDLAAIDSLQLNVNAERLRDILLRSPKLHLKPNSFVVAGRDTLLVRPPPRKAASRIRAERARAKDAAKEKERLAITENMAPRGPGGVALHPGGSSGGGGGGAGGRAAGGAGGGGAGGSGAGGKSDGKGGARARSGSNASGSSSAGASQRAPGGGEDGEEDSVVEEEEDDYPEYEYEALPPPVQGARRRGGGRGGTASSAPSDEPVSNYVAEVLLSGAPLGSAPSSSTVSARDDTYYSLQALKETLPHILVAGIGDVARTVISRDDEGNGKGKHKLIIAATAGKACLLDVMGVPGVKASCCVSNDIINTSGVLGIEAARSLIIQQLIDTYFNYGINVDLRHTQLLSDIMTYRGAVLGITRFGIAKMKDSVLMLASFEKTPDHLFEAAVHSRGDPCRGVSESIIVGTPIPLGTGLFKLFTPPVTDEGAGQRQAAAAAAAAAAAGAGAGAAEGSGSASSSKGRKVSFAAGGGGGGGEGGSSSSTRQLPARVEGQGILGTVSERPSGASGSMPGQGHFVVTLPNTVAAVRRSSQQHLAGIRAGVGLPGGASSSSSSSGGAAPVTLAAVVGPAYSPLLNSL